MACLPGCGRGQTRKEGTDQHGPLYVPWGGWQEENHNLRVGPPRKDLDGSCTVSHWVKTIPYALARHPPPPESPRLARFGVQSKMEFRIHRDKANLLAPVPFIFHACPMEENVS